MIFKKVRLIKWYFKIPGFFYKKSTEIIIGLSFNYINVRKKYCNDKN